MFSILSEFRFVSDVLLRNRIGASIKLKTCETGSNFTIFDDNISKFNLAWSYFGISDLENGFKFYEYRKEKIEPKEKTLEVKKLPKGTFSSYMKSIGKLGGQNKIPRLSNNRDFVEGLLKK